MDAPKKTIICENLHDLKNAAHELIHYCSGKKIFAFSGAMGAGKTTFIKAICLELGSTENITSPTFSLVNEYLDGNGETLYHFDFYRIKNETEAYDIGFEEYLESGNYCFIEWPEKISSLLPPETVRVQIDVTDSKRAISIFS